MTNKLEIERFGNKGTIWMLAGANVMRTDGSGEGVWVDRITNWEGQSKTETVQTHGTGQFKLPGWDGTPATNRKIKRLIRAQFPA